MEIRVNPNDQIIGGHLYKMEIHWFDIADIPVYKGLIRKLKIKNKLNDRGVACKWRFELWGDTEVFTYSLTKIIRLTHHDVFEAVKAVFAETMQIDLWDLGEGQLPVEYGQKDLGSKIVEPLEKLPELLEKVPEWVEKNWWKALIILGIGLLLIIWGFGYIKKPVIIIKK